MHGIDLIRGVALAVQTHLDRCKLWYIALTTGVIVIVVLGCSFICPPSGFPTGSYISIEEGMTGREVAIELANQRVISSPVMFRILMRLMPNHGITAGVYRFEHPVTAITVAWNLTHAISGIPTIKVTFPEGLTVSEMGQILSEKLPNFSKARFVEIARPAEGYLFPDTYFFLPGTTEAEAFQIMRNNFDAHTKDLASQAERFGRSPEEIIIMASILEGEGKTTDERKTIAGILWRRLSVNMPLQVDAAFGYEHGVHGYAPTAADIREDSAYNTYRYKGLPPTPISNPGIEAIDAALTPTQTSYLYYLTGKNGQTYYAKTYTEHLRNLEKYLK